MSPMVETARITILADNQAGGGLRAEHGLSLWIEVAGRRILFDTGQGAVLGDNATKLGIDLGTAENVVLSHGHYDHTGGLALLAHRSSTFQLHAHPSLLLPRYSIRGQAVRDIAIPESGRLALQCLPRERIHWTTAATEISPGVGITGPIPRATDYEDSGGPFFLDRERRRRDPVEDDQALWIRTPLGLVVALGCGHSGVVNTLNHVIQVAGTPRIHAVMGGFHMSEASATRIERTLRALAEMAPDWVVPCHCTGEKTVERFKRMLGDRLVPGRAGKVLRFGVVPPNRS
jgi:7,8-dihydropterin-6-yl-methyl-4-(beta-D-ribofuranosyl)aminobenzene 5'-phosphate synthase